MTDTRTYDVAGATLTVTLALSVHTISIAMTLDVAALDTNEPDHSSHNLIEYVSPLLSPTWTSWQTHYWCKLHRANITCKSGSQARRIREHAITKLADVISQAQLDRARRKAEMAVAIA